MAFANLSFEVAGSSPGEAASWVWDRSTSWHFAAHPRADGGHTRWEAFEFGWGADAFVDALTPSNTLDAVYNTSLGDVALDRNFDGFEIGWADGFEFVLSGTEAAEYLLHGPIFRRVFTSFESFEGSWFDNEDFVFAFTAPELATEGTDNFEAGWQNNTYEFAFVPLDLSAALYHLGLATRTFEGFEGVKFDITFAVDTFSNVVLAPAHGFSDNDEILFQASHAEFSVLPGPLNDRQFFFVVTALANQFQVALTSGGAPIAFTDPGSGVNYVRANPFLVWIGQDLDQDGSEE